MLMKGTDFIQTKRKRMVIMYNSAEIGFGNDAPSQLRELAIHLDREGFDWSWVRLLEDVKEELIEFREGDITVEDIEEIIHQNFNEEELGYIRSSVDEGIRSYSGDSNQDESKERAIEKLVSWQAMNKDELKKQLKIRSLKTTGTKNEMFERLSKTL